MIDIDAWLEEFCGRLDENFPGRVWFLGLQGSYARGEAKDSSDIDIVVIFDRLTMNDLQRYREMLDGLPEREKICGFVSGRDELMHWETSDLFQFCRDTLPIRGSLAEVLALVSDESVKRAVLSGACNVYHACVHNFLHERDADILAGLVSQEEREILRPDSGLGFDELSGKLFAWAGRRLTE